METQKIQLAETPAIDTLTIGGIEIDLGKVKESLKAGYLPDYVGDSSLINYCDLFVSTETGYYALENDVITTSEGDIYHCSMDSEEYFYSEYEDEYHNESLIGNEYYPIVDRNGNVEDYVPCNAAVYSNHHDGYILSEKAVFAHDIQDYIHVGCAIYHNGYYYFEAPQPETGPDILPSYHDREADLMDVTTFIPCRFRNEKIGGRIGIEIEKSEFPDFITTDEIEDMADNGHILQKDSSVEDGFEVATAAFDLFGDDFESACKNELRPYIEAPGYIDAGGHITVSLVLRGNKTIPGLDLFNEISGYLPLLYALYPGRAKCNWCEAKRKEEILEERDRYFAMNVKIDRLEIRIFPPFKSVSQTIWRANLCRFMLKNPGSSELEVLRQCLKPNSPLNSLMLEGAYKDREEEYFDMIDRQILLIEKYTDGEVPNNLKQVAKDLKTIKKPKGSNK